MAARLGNVLYWIGCSISVLCVIALFLLGSKAITIQSRKDVLLFLVSIIYLLPIGAISFYVGRFCRNKLAQVETAFAKGTLRLWLAASLAAWLYLIWFSQAGCYVAKFLRISPPDLFCAFPIADPLEHYALLGFRMVLASAAIGAALATVTWVVSGFKNRP